MLNELVGQFLKTSDGSGLLQDLVSKGLTEHQVTQAVTATAEGAVEHGGAAGLDLGSLAGGLLGSGGLGGLAGMLGGSGGAAGAGGGLGGVLGSMLGGSGTAGAGGGLGGMLGGMLGGAATPAAGGAGSLAALVAPISQFVAQKTGLAPAMAQMVVSTALPKLLALFSGAGGAAAGAAPAGAAAPSAGGSLGDMLGSLLK